MNKYIYSILMIELLGLSIYDFYKKKIPNIAILTNLFLFLIVFFLFDKENYYQPNINLFLFPILFIFFGFYLFRLNIMGGGDSKLLASIFLFVPSALQYIYLDFLLYTTLLVAFLTFVINTFSNTSKILMALKKKNTLLLKGIWGTKFPFAPVIILSWLWFGWNIYIKK